MWWYGEAVVWRCNCMLVYWHAGVLVCWSVGVLVCWYVGMSVCWCVGMLDCCGDVTLPIMVMQIWGGVMM